MSFLKPRISFIFLLPFISLFLAANASCNEPKLGAQQILAIPFRSHDYSYLKEDILLIKSKNELDNFFLEIEKNDSWNDSSKLVNALKTQSIDFSQHRLLLWRVIEGSSSVQLKLKNTASSDDVLTLSLERTVPDIGLTDMAYYLYGFLVDGTIKKIQLQGKGKEVLLETN